MYVYIKKEYHNEHPYPHYEDSATVDIFQISFIYNVLFI